MTNPPSKELDQARSLIIKANIAFSGDLDKASNYVQDAERILNSIADDPASERVRIDLLRIKAWISLLKGNFISAKELAQECLISLTMTEIKSNVNLNRRRILIVNKKEDIKKNISLLCQIGVSVRFFHFRPVSPPKIHNHIFYKHVS